MKKLGVLALALAALAIAGCYPNPSSTGVPNGWVPQSTTSSNINLTQDGQVLHDVRLTNGADINVSGHNVTIRNVQMEGGGYIDNQIGSGCGTGLVIDHVTMLGPDNQDNGQEGHISGGSYTVQHSEINGLHEGLRVSDTAFGCGAVTVDDTFIRITPPDTCGDWHGDGIQSYGGGPVTVRNSTIDMGQPSYGSCTGTAPFFRPYGQGNTGCATIDGLLVMGQGYPFRLGTCGTVKGLQIVDHSWFFGPIDVKCSLISSWSAQIVNINADYGVTGVVREQPCDTERGG